MILLAAYAGLRVSEIAAKKATASTPSSTPSPSTGAPSPAVAGPGDVMEDNVVVQQRVSADTRVVEATLVRSRKSCHIGIDPASGSYGRTGGFPISLTRNRCWTRTTQDFDGDVAGHPARPAGPSARRRARFPDHRARSGSALHQRPDDRVAKGLDRQRHLTRTRTGTSLASVPSSALAAMNQLAQGCRRVLR